MGDITILNKLDLPQSNDLTGMDRSETSIDWINMPIYYKFFFDREGQEKEIELALKESSLSKKDKLIILYGWREPVIKISTKLFIDDWEGFIRSTLWETIMFSEDFELIMEVSRDYYLHSNFKIK